MVRIKPVATRSSPKQIIGMGTTDGTLGLMGNYTWAWEQVVFKWMGNQIGNGSNVRFGSFVAKLVFFQLQVWGTRVFLSLHVSFKQNLGATKRAEILNHLLWRNQELLLSFFVSDYSRDFYPAGYLCSKNISREALKKTSKNITISQRPTSQLQNI